MAEQLLTRAEIQDRIQRFNETSPYDWSIFDDVPQSQSVDIMYPFTISEALLTQISKDNNVDN